MRGGGFPGRAAQGLGLLLYSPGSHGGHIKWPPARAELATNLTPAPPGPGIRRARRGNVTCQKGTGLFGRFYLGKRRVPAVNCPHLSHGDQRRFRKYAANFGLAEHTGVLRYQTRR